MEAVGVVWVRFKAVWVLGLEVQILAIDLMPDTEHRTAKVIVKRCANSEVLPELVAKADVVA
ncbi:protein of unknown function [Thauera humireducens]|nr:protein of unknown function [Thauera humireducens]